MNFEDELSMLSPEERELALKILGDISNKGASDDYNKILYDDYEEIPVDIETFLHDRKYLGNALYDSEGRFTLFPYWEDLLKRIYPNPLEPAKCNTLALTGAIGLGKSTEAVLVGIYELYRMLCLKDPYVHYGLQPIDLITFAVINITMDAAKGVAWNKLQSMIQASPWFMSHGTVNKADLPEWHPPKGIELIYGSQTRHVIGRAVYWCFEDEVSFQPNQDVEKQKEKAKMLVNTVTARMQSRFMRGDVNPTIFVLASSKRTEQSFMETFIENKKKNESKTTWVIDEPQWIIRTDKNSDRKFKVAIGNKFLNSEVLPLNISEHDLQIYINKGFKILDVPIGYYENFLDDIDIALTDIAGISTSNVTRYIAGPRVAAIKKPNIQNLFTQDVIEVGDAPDDLTQYKDFFDMERLDLKMKSRPMYIHMDLSERGDKTGIAGVWIIGKKPHQEGVPDSKELYYRAAFSVSIKAPKGHAISFEKNRQFIYFLRESGFSVRGISTDTFQSFDTGQMLKAKGFNYETISVDRLTDRVCQPYLALKNAIYEERLELYENKLLTEELIGLERDSNGKIDHGPSGINCLTGDTKIDLVDGRTLTMLELVEEFNEGKSNYVYAFNHDSGLVECSKITKAWCSGRNAKIMIVTLDNGERVRCTPEHRFMLRNGEYCEAQNLLPGDSLMPLYTKISNKGLCGYRLVYQPVTDKWNYEHRLFASKVLDDKYLVHHIDCNKLNNHPDNLIWMSKKAHIEVHSNNGTGAYSPDALQKKSVSVKKFHAEGRLNPSYWTRFYPGVSTEEAVKKHEEHVLERERRLRVKALRKDRVTHRQKQLSMQRDMYNYYGLEEGSLQGIKLRNMMIKYKHVVDPTYQEKVSKAISENHTLGKYENAKKALQSSNEHMKSLKTLFPDVDRVEFSDMFNLDYDSLTKSQKGVWSNRYRQRKYELLNHKVVAIEFVDDVEDVFDLTIENNHNFALNAGVFVHNSKDQADALCGALYNASKHAEEFAFEFGEDIEAMIQGSVGDQAYNKEQITLDFEEALKQTSPAYRQMKESDYFIDFGMGKAKPYQDQGYLLSGIIL